MGREGDVKRRMVVESVGVCDEACDGQPFGERWLRGPVPVRVFWEGFCFEDGAEMRP